jgi:hypothetical protein
MTADVSGNYVGRKSVAPSGKLSTTNHKMECYDYSFYHLLGGIGKLVTPDGAKAYQAYVVTSL